MVSIAANRCISRYACPGMKWVKTLVFRVRLCTSPLRSTISKAKLPFWLTGEKVSRLRCPLRTPGTLLDKLADAGADTGTSCLVSIGCGMAFGAVNKLLGFDGNGNTSAMSDLPIMVQVEVRSRTWALLAEKAACWLRRGRIFTCLSLDAGLS